MGEYESKAVVTSIKATSRASVCINKNYYTVEYCEERMIPDTNGVDIEEERRILWNVVNSECDKQVEEIARTFKNNR